MLKRALFALAAMGAVAISTPAEAGHRDRGRTQIVVSVGTPVYYGHPYGGYYSGYPTPYYQPNYYERPRYYYRPRYHYRPRYYYSDPYYRPHRKYWKERYRHRNYHRDYYYRDH